MLTQICQYLRNWFERDKYIGSFQISGGALTDATGSAPPLLDGQYFRIVGSVLNDGVHQWPAYDLSDEEFTGAVWSMAVPPAILDLDREIEAWQDKYGGVDSALLSPFASESFGGYSYSKATGGAASGGGTVTSWEALYAARLAPWRKI